MVLHCRVDPLITLSLAHIKSVNKRTPSQMSATTRPRHWSPTKRSHKICNRICRRSIANIASLSRRQFLQGSLLLLLVVRKRKQQWRNELWRRMRDEVLNVVTFNTTFNRNSYSSANLFPCSHFPSLILIIF